MKTTEENKPNYDLTAAIQAAVEAERMRCYEIVMAARMGEHLPMPARIYGR